LTVVSVRDGQVESFNSLDPLFSLELDSSGEVNSSLGEFSVSRNLSESFLLSVSRVGQLSSESFFVDLMGQLEGILFSVPSRETRSSSVGGLTGVRTREWRFSVDVSIDLGNFFSSLGKVEFSLDRLSVN